MGASRSLMGNVLDCQIVLSELELKSRYYVLFRTSIKGISACPPSGEYLISTTTVLLKGGFGIKYSSKVDMPLKQRN